MLMDFYHFFLLYSWMPSVFYILAYEIPILFPNYHMQLGQFLSLYMLFYSLFWGLSLAHTLNSVMLDSIIYALYSLSGLSLAHTLIIWFYILYMFSTAPMGLPLTHILICLFFLAIWVNFS